jgi:3'(2'), 5'-bisphosphate nucleotidase
MIDIAVKAAIDAGEAILGIYEQDFEVEFKADESPLTAADKAGHEIIVKALEATPYPVLSEESGSISYEERKQWETYWLVDPLDGTKEFIKKNGEFTVNIALVKNGQPVAGVVYVPVQDTLYLGLGEGSGEQEKGAWKVVGCKGKTCDDIKDSGQPITVSGTPVGSLKVVASKSHCNDDTRNFITALETKYGEPELVSRGSSLKLCMVAEGSADIYPRIAPTMEWDTGAAHAVVEAAGGSVFKYDDSISATDYTAGNNGINNLSYNKQDLLNPYFVVSGLHK